jgi:hypothetical protein
VVDFGYEAVVELLLLVGSAVVHTVTQYYNTSLLSGYKCCHCHKIYATKY